MNKNKVDELVNQFIQDRRVVGISVAIVGPGTVEYYNYGSTKIGGPLPTENSLYEIGSISKTFTSLALAISAKEKSLVTSYYTKTTLSKSMTNMHLSTHTSGLPEMPSNFKSESSYRETDLLNYLSKARIKTKPGMKWNYSSLAVGMLGLELAKLKGLTYEKLLKTQITDILGMSHTSVIPSTEDASLMVQPYTDRLRATSVLRWGSDALVGAGGIKSNCVDMAKYVNAQNGTTTTSLDKHIAKTHEQAYKGNVVMGMGWIFNGDWLYHDGLTNGCSSYMSFDPFTKTGVVVLCNTMSYDLTDLGIALQNMALNKPYITRSSAKKTGRKKWYSAPTFQS